MKNGAKNYIVGWTKNNSANWTQDEANFTSVEWDTIAARSRFNKVVQEYTCFSTNQNPETVIEGLLASTNYKIKIYNTYDNANEIEVQNASTGFNGRLSFRRDMYSYINDPFNSDYSFIIKPNSTWRIDKNTVIASDTIYTTTSDTITIRSRFTMDSSLFKFNWVLDNNYINHNNTIVKNYPLEGTFSVNLEANGLESDSIIKHNFIIKVSDSEISKKLENITVYPNPANNFLYIYYDKETFKNPKITCIDLLGKIQDFQQIEHNKFNTTNLADGLYIVKIQYTNYEKVFKVNIIH
ncbi:MAG: T9SS type A sorting domain-containing protein [Bacteroidia bacterium]|nr:T9SS type A sorting domain-containing protein [Bacteroidia bacterium]